MPHSAPANQAHHLLSWQDLSLWQRDNKYIRNHYRPNLSSYHFSFASVLKLHNQSVNIHTHLFGALLFIACAWWFHHRSMQYATISSADVFVFNCFFLGVIACLGTSAVFHTLADHSKEVCRRWMMYDMLGIAGLITGSFFPGVYYGFYCEPEIVRTYWAMITILGAVCAAVCIVPRFQTIKWRTFRAVMFVMVGLSGVLPMSHAVRIFGVRQANLQMGWSWFIWEAVFYISGAVIYGTRIPERWSPGRFDLYGASHQLFHVLVLLGAWSHFTGISIAFRYNHDPQTRRC